MALDALACRSKLRIDELKQSLLFATAVMLSACAALPEVPPIERGSIERVGIYVSEIGQPKQTHIGTTIFNNNVKEYALQWDLREEFRNTIAGVLEEAGFKVVDLVSAGYSSGDLSVARIAEDGGGHAPENEQTRARLREDGVDAVVIIREQERVLALLSCAQFGCTEHWAEGYGLLTRSFLGIGHARVVFAFDFEADVVDPPASVSDSAEMEEFQGWQSKTLLLEPRPDDLKDVEQASWESVRQHLNNMLSERVERVAAVLSGQG